MIHVLKRCFTLGCLTLLLSTLLYLGLFAGMGMPIAVALPAGNAITDGSALLRYALPIDNSAVRELQANLEDIASQLRSSKRWGAVSRDVNKASQILSDRGTELLASVPEEHKPAATATLAALKTQMTDLQALVETKDKEQVAQKRTEVLNLVGDLEAAMVKKPPSEVPAEYRHLPQLQGRATIDITTNKGSLTVVVDGYSAPVTAGNFVDLVQRGFYNGLAFTRAEESYVLQIGDPPGAAAGFIDPTTQQYRSIPLEILVQGDPTPTYGITLEDAGRYLAQPVLPFSAYGAVALARPSDDPNGGSSQFFFFLFEPELTPAGLNLLDGRYAVFGYVVAGKEVLEKLRAGDTIESAQVVQGTENLVLPAIS
ncbi:peptidylprolyl isomerase [Neosynechococcus sphagnicola sy1]|uniref:peptidylprolyl isomerase n=2 Tax=Neosynechococcus TaxID=1501143 RepID=A0A098THI6_9CYAN|nr:peptidylprolyl isomerase [Neosynechococcus sphagnicola sy1]